MAESRIIDMENPFSYMDLAMKQASRHVPLRPVQPGSKHSNWVLKLFSGGPTWRHIKKL
jgi:hypothetical protein